MITALHQFTNQVKTFIMHPHHRPINHGLQSNASKEGQTVAWPTEALQGYRVTGRPHEYTQGSTQSAE